MIANWTHLAFHSAFSDGENIVGWKLWLSHLYSKVKSTKTMTFFSTSCFQNFTGQWGEKVLPEENMMLETWFCTSFSAGISFQVAKKTLRSTRKKKVSISHYFLAKMELRKFRTRAVRATRGRWRKGKIMQIKGKKQERFRPRSSRLHRSPLTRALDLLWLKRNIRDCSLTHLSVFSKQHIIRNSTTEVEHVHIILNGYLKVG